MEKLWSPWRSRYIDSFKDKSGDEKCVFCNAKEIDINEEHSLIVHQAEYCFVVLNLYPYNSGHLMVVPYRHVCDLNELTAEEIAEMMSWVQKSMKTLEKLMKPQGFNFGANIGKAAGAGIDTHLHFHVLPRWNGDTNFMPALGEVKVISQDLMETKQRLRQAFKEL